MAEINSFPNNSDEYQGAEEVMRWLHGRTKGVYAGEGNAAVVAVAGTMQVQVAKGIGWITDANDDGVCWWFDTPITLAIDAAESTGTLNRIDRVIIEWQTTDYAALPEVKILKGANRSVATPPALTNNSTVRQMSLARISIPAGTTQLTALNVIDERMDETVCGIVTETATADTSMIAAQYEEALQTLYDAISEAWGGVISDGAIDTDKIADEAVDTDKLADGAITPDKVDSTLLAAVCDMIYPVGSLYMSTDSTSPASRFGGTWERIKDKFLLSAGDTYAAGATGGAATVTLTEANLPSHNHSIPALTANKTFHFDFVGWKNGTTSGADGAINKTINMKSPGSGSDYGGTAGDYTPKTDANTTGSKGSGTAVDKMPPYLAVYVWKRVA